MFEKLLANLPFHPAVINQFVFYGKRMSREASLRRLGLVFVGLALLVQIIAVAAPPQPTLARSNNDMINGGISSRSEAVTACQHNVVNYGDVLHYYGISCADVANTATVSLRSTDYNRQLDSLGRLPYGKAGETPASIGGKTYYWSYLWGWDSHAYSTYQVLQGKSSLTGRTFFIMYHCGNLVFVGPPAAPPVCTWNPALYASDSRCQAPACPLDKSIAASSPGCKSCAYDSHILKTNRLCVACPYQQLGAITSSNPLCKPPCPYNSSISNDNIQCKPCSAAQTRDDKTACLELSKTASNTTQGLPDANNTTAKAGDTLSYSLVVKNDGKVAVPKFVIQENMSDVLDYADIVDLHGATLDNDTKVVSWGAQTIPAHATVTEHLTVKIKNPIPQTPVSVSDPGHYDLKMTNVYGNTVTINLPPSAVQTTEQIVQSLPNTGPGTSLLIGFGVSLFVGYFFARARLLAKETRLIINTQTTQGGIS